MRKGLLAGVSRQQFSIALVFSALFSVSCSSLSGGLTGETSLVDALGHSASSQGTSREAPALALRLFDGGELTLSELSGKPVVMSFWASWCPPCKEEAPILEKVWKSYKDKGVVFVGVNVQDTESSAREFLRQYGVTYPNGPDNTRQILEDYAVTSIPTTFFITGDGRIARKWVGPLNENQLLILVESLLK